MANISKAYKQHLCHASFTREARWQGTSRHRAKGKAGNSGILPRNGQIEQVWLESVFNRPGWTKLARLWHTNRNHATLCEFMVLFPFLRHYTYWRNDSGIWIDRTPLLDCPIIGKMALNYSPNGQLHSGEAFYQLAYLCVAITVLSTFFLRRGAKNKYNTHTYTYPEKLI